MAETWASAIAALPCYSAGAFDHFEPVYRKADLDALLARLPAQPRNEWRLDDQGCLDDVVVDDVETFRLERMSDDHIWGAVYRRDGSRTDFNIFGDRVSLTHEHETRSPDGDGLGMTEPNTDADSAFARASNASGAAKPSGETTAANAERNSPKVGAGSEPAESQPSSRLPAPQETPPHIEGEWAMAATAYAREQVIPLRASDPDYAGTPYERGLMQRLSATFRDGWLAACERFRSIAAQRVSPPPLQDLIDQWRETGRTARQKADEPSREVVSRGNCAGYAMAKFECADMLATRLELAGVSPPPPPSDLLSAAMKWWEGRRPISWSESKHFEQPTINCTTPREKNLALALVEALRGGVPRLTGRSRPSHD